MKKIINGKFVSNKLKMEFTLGELLLFIIAVVLGCYFLFQIF